MARPRRADPLIPDLVAVGVHATRSVLFDVVDAVTNDPETALEPDRLGKRRKKALRIDAYAEDTYKRVLRRYHRGAFADIDFFGEESLRNPELDLSDHGGIVVLVDAIDGTDLLERGLSNWCCASIFFKPSAEEGRRILAAFVGLPDGTVYYATADHRKPLVTRGRTMGAGPVCGVSRRRGLAQASIYFYGQKLKNFRSVTHDGFAQRLSDVCEGTKEDRLRIYNLAGTPMMARMTDHRVREANGIDAVFDVFGQQPHDVVPGAYIAKKAGAIIRDLDGGDISFVKLEELLLRPAKLRLQYVLAVTSTLAAQITECIRSNGLERERSNPPNPSIRAKAARSRSRH